MSEWTKDSLKGQRCSVHALRMSGEPVDSVHADEWASALDHIEQQARTIEELHNWKEDHRVVKLVERIDQRDKKIAEQARTIEEQNRHYQDLENVAVSQKISRDERIAALEERNKDLENYEHLYRALGSDRCQCGDDDACRFVHRIAELEGRAAMACESPCGDCAGCNQAREYFVPNESPGGPK